MATPPAAPGGRPKSTHPPPSPQRTRPLPTPPPRPRARASRLGILLVVPVLLAASLGACKTSWDLEDRETPVHVVLVAPAAATAEQRLPLVVYVGDRKAVDGTVLFPAGTTHVAAPTLPMRAGAKPVSVILSGRSVATSNVTVKGPTWIVVTVTGTGASIASDTQDPTAAR